MFIGVRDSYHNLASPTNVKQTLWTLITFGKWYAFVQSLVWSKWASESSSGFPEISGLKCDQFKCTIYCPCCVGCMVCCVCCAGSGWAGEGGGAGISGACCPASAILYLF